MPATGILSKEHSQEECDTQNLSLDIVHNSASSLPAHALENKQTEVNMTSMDADCVAGTPAIHSSNMDVSSDFVVDASQELNSGIPTTLPKIKGFQNTFSEVNSAPCGDAEDETNVDVSTGATEEATVVELQASSANDATPAPTTVPSFEYEAEVENVQTVATDTAADSQQVVNAESDCDMQLGLDHGQVTDLAAQREGAEPAASDCVYFIQTTDASGQVVASIIDPNNISLYADSVIYKQCLNSDGEIETTVVHSGRSQEDTDSQQVLQQEEQQIIYAHGLNGQLIPLDPVQTANDVAPPDKQFVYMQDSSGRVIRTVMDASQNMVPGQQVFYTQSDDGQIITSLMESGENGEEHQQLRGKQVYQQQGIDGSTSDQQLNAMDMTQRQGNDADITDQGLSGGEVTDQQPANEVDIVQHQAETKAHVLGRGASFSIDNSLSGLSMLAELSHLTSGQGVVAEEQKLPPVTDSSNSVDMDGLRPVAKVAEHAPSSSEGLESVSSDIGELKVTETDSDSLDHGSLSQADSTGHSESLLAKIVSQVRQASPSVCRDNLFIQWQNLDAMCWMDVILIMLVHSPSLRTLSELDPSHELASTLLVTLLKANRQAQILLQNLLKKHSAVVMTDPNSAAPVQDPKTSKIVCKENMDEIGKAINVLYAMREKIWLALQPRLRCERGKHNSPVLVLPLLVRENPTVKQMFTMRYRYVFKCDKCSYTQDDSHSKILPSIPTVPEDFNMAAPCFVRSCFECQAPNQRMMMKFEQLQDFVQMHFVKGLPHSRFDELSFDFNDDHYEVTAFVHYKNNPDHFIAWVRNAPGTMWMECDDLKSVITRYTQTPLNIPPSQVHMVMWERRLTPQHTLTMRDTEDTKLLASLVLTVQQPNTHHNTDADTRSSATAGSSATSQSSTSLLSGLMTQSLANYPYRGRGFVKGDRNNGVHAGASNVSSIRPMNPVTSQLSAVGNPQPGAQPRIIRLPLSALAGSGLNLRGGPPGAARYVLVGNNSQGGTLSRAGTSSRVVVVRTPGGTASMSATQLLQLLQQSGAVSQGGTRLTAAVSSSGANTVAPTAAAVSYLVQQDGTIMTTTSSNEVSESSGLIEPVQAFASEHGVDSSMETSDTNTQNDCENAPSSAVASPTISTLPFITSGHTVKPDTTVKSLELDARSALPCSQGGTSSASVTGIQSNASGQLANPAEIQQPRYLRVKNPGGGTFLCQLAMKDGKMVLIPVDRSAQSGSTDTSMLKLPSSTAGTQEEYGNMLAQIRTQLLQSRNQAVTSRAKQVNIPGSQGAADQPAPVTLNPAGRCTDADPASSIASCVSSASHEQQQVEETYRYINPGSNTTHILHTGTSETQGSLGQSRDTALSSSSAARVASGDPELIINNYDKNQSTVLTPKQRLSKELDTTEYIPLGPGRTRGAHRGGRGRGRRGRGRAASSISEAEPAAPSAVGRHISTFSDLKQIGAHIIRAESEAIDGVPVVSIPDFSTEIDARTIMPEINTDLASDDTDSVSQQAHDGLSVCHGASSVLGSQVVTQQITNHSFNVLTQGIQSSPDRSRPPSSTLKHARSLLTGRTTTLQSPSSLLTSLSETTAATQVLPSPDTSEQAEVDVHTQQTSGSQALDADPGFHFGESGVRLDNAGANTKYSSVSVHGNVFTQPEAEESDSVMSVEDNQSTAERYRMPTELFQPEEESPEKSVKLDESRSSLSPGLFPESEMGSLDETQGKSLKVNVNPACSPLREVDVEKTDVKPGSLEDNNRIVIGLENTSGDVVENIETTFSRKGRYRAVTSRYKIQKSDSEPEPQCAAAVSTDGSTCNDTIAESNSAEISSPATESLLSRTDSVEQSIPFDGERVVTGASVEDGGSVDVEEEYHSVKGSTRARGRSRNWSSKKRGRKGSKGTKLAPMHVPESDAVQHIEPEPLDVDSCTVEPTVDSSVAGELDLKNPDVTDDQQHEEALPLLEDGQHEGSGALVEDSQNHGPGGFVEDGQCGESIPLVEDSQCGESIPLVEDSQCGESIPLVEDSQCGESIPLVEDGQNQQDEPVPSSVIPRKMRRSRGRSRIGRIMKGKRGKSAKPIKTESMEVNNIGTDSPSPVAEQAVTSPENRPNGASDPLPSLGNTRVPCLEPSEGISTGNLVMGPAIEADCALEQVEEDREQMSAEVNCQVESKCGMGLKLDTSEEKLEVDVKVEEGKKLADMNSVSMKLVSQPPLEASVDGGITAGTSSEGFTDIFKRDDDDPLGGCRTLAASSSGLATDVLLETDLHAVEHSTQFSGEGITETDRETDHNEVDVENSKSLCKPRRGAKGRARKTGKKRSNLTAVLKTEEVCRSGSQSVKEAAAVEPLGSSPPQSPRAGPSHLETSSTSSVQVLSGSLSDDGLPCKSEEELRGDHLEIKEDHQGIMAVAESSTSEKSGRLSKSKELKGKFRGKRKLENSVEHSETSDTFVTISPKIRAVNLKSTLHSKENLSSKPAKQSTSLEHRKRGVSTAAKKVVQKKAKMEQEVKEKAASSLAVGCYKKRKVDWGVVSDLGNRSDPRASFSYSVLTDKRLSSKTRQSSLEKKQEWFVSPRYSRPADKPALCSQTSEESSPAVVKRWRPKPQQKPEIDSSHDVIPLSMNKQLYPGYSGGSVVKDGSAFTGVVMKRRQTRPDWSCSIDPDQTLGVTREKFQTVPVKYCKRLISSLCISSGSFSATVGVSGVCSKKLVGSDDTEADSGDNNVGGLENICNRAEVESVKVRNDSGKSCADEAADSGETCADMVADAGKSCEDKVADSVEACTGEAADSGETCADMVADSGEICADMVADSGETCADMVADSGETCADEVAVTGETCDDQMIDSGKPCDREVVDSGKVCDGEVVDSGKPCDGEVVDSGKVCDDVTESETACDSCPVTTDNGDDVCAETNSDQAVCASNVSVNKSRKNSRQTKGKQKTQSKLSTESTHTAKLSTDSTHPAKLSTGSTRPTKLSTDSTRPAKLSTDSTRPAKLSTSSTRPAKLSTDSTRLAKLSTSSTRTAKLSTSSTHTAKLSTDSTSTAKLSTSSTRTAKLSTDSTRPAKFSTDSTRTAKLSTSSTRQAKLSTDSTSTAKLSTSSNRPAKRAKVSQNVSCSGKLGDPPAHANATATTLTPAEAVGNLPPGASCSSPTRRSGRTPIPSKKILDALEYLKMPSALKLHRVSSVGSDDLQAESSSDVNVESLPLP